MIDFLLKHYSLLTYSVELLAALTGVFVFKKYRSVSVRYFIYFLILVFICDSLNSYTSFVKPNLALEFLIGTKFEKNFWWSNIYWGIGAIMFFSFYYRLVLKNHKYKSYIKILSYSYLIFSIAYIILNWTAFFISNFIVLELLGAFIILVCVALYFVEILNSDRILNFYKSISFYISATIFVWWLIITPITFYDVYFVYEVGIGHFDKDFLVLRNFVYLSANIFMYLTYTFAFIWCKPVNE